MDRSGKDRQLKKLPPMTLFVVVLSFVLVFLAIIGLLFPQQKRIQAAEQDRTDKTLRLEEQKKLFPLYAQAEALEKIPFNPELPLVERTPLDRDQIATLSTTFSDIARSRNMILTGNSLDINSLYRQAGSLSMELEFTGELTDFRDCLITLAELPFFKAVEAVSIETDTSNIKTFNTKILIAVN